MPKQGTKHTQNNPDGINMNIEAHNKNSHGEIKPP